ncbi:hypothetical protein [Actinomadura parmotrematis]|uniref:Uncharacterized protein n=1 Tax=Actinomadura parmotrematis TaxID=2864039 RepID=A0ABS7G778_9ACTN|nr:hypothetical protein [Actinomadura parmotrematis]MBW8487719.1 hypothetical protein [Actinomadura parmotrematis]
MKDPHRRPSGSPVRVAINAWATAIPTPGRTPGHTVYDEHGDGDVHLLVWGDTVHVPALQFTCPKVPWEFDTDQSRARAARVALTATGYALHHLAPPLD